jgi:hypothetical protein
MSATNYARNKMLDCIFGGITLTPPANYYIGLSTTSISTSGSNASEPVGAAYARVQIPNNKSYFSYGVSGSLINITDITFTESSGSWGTITDIGFWDASTSGSVWYYTTLGVPKIVQDTTVITFSASSITLSQS